MSDLSTLTSGVAGRYSTALFELALEAGELDTVERDLGAVKEAMAGSEDLRSLIGSPLYGRGEQASALAAVADAMELGRTVKNLLGLLAEKRRLFALPAVIAQFEALVAEHRGEVTAEVASARELSDAQAAALKEKLGAVTGRDVRLDISVDPSLIGGLVVKVGSRMIDTSIRSKLQGLQTAMKEVG